MSKGNIFMGMARGKVGDVVLTRMDGEQVTRVRNRHPKNPKTPKQLLQRAVMATIMQAYSAGKEIFDHSFEGFAVPAGCQRRFQSVNAKALRAIMAADINGAVAIGSQNGQVVAPGAKTPVGFTGMIVSEGSLVNAQFSWSPTGAGFNMGTGAFIDGTLAELCSDYGFNEGDIFTIVGYAQNSDAVFTINGLDTVRSKQYDGGFFAVRLELIAGATTSATELTNPTLSQIFNITTFGLVKDNYDVSAVNYIKPADIVPTGYTATHVAMIKSRDDSGERSNAKLVLAYTPTAEGQVSGIASSYALAAWQQGTPDLGDSDLILEGGDV